MFCDTLQGEGYWLNRVSVTPSTQWIVDNQVGYVIVILLCKKWLDLRLPTKQLMGESSGFNHLFLLNNTFQTINIKTDRTIPETGNTHFGNEAICKTNPVILAKNVIPAISIAIVLL